METAATGSPPRAATPMRTVIVASSVGTAFEWYDFFVYGALTSIISANFFGKLGEPAATVAALAVFAAGLIFRPVGAFVFGRIGDRFGRKGAFLATVTIMGGATFAIGLLPTYAQVGETAVILLVALRILQGLAVGGEYGGAAIYVAEHAEPHRRGVTTGWIQSSAAFGLVGALGVVLATRSLIGEPAMLGWGWRVPFLASAFLLGISIWMRLKLQESPAFVKMKEEGAVSRAPFADVFLRWSNLKLVLIALVSLFLAQGPIWYSIFFYTQVFLEKFTKVQGDWVNYILIGAVVLSIPLYNFFAWLSDKVGRKPVLLLGMTLAVVAMFPAFRAIATGANGALFAAQERAPVTVLADQSTCSFQFDLLGRNKYQTGCDIARNILTNAGVSYKSAATPGATGTVIRIGEAEITAVDATGLAGTELAAHTGDIDKRIKAALRDAGYPPTDPASADPAAFNWPLIIAGFVVLVVAATALYGPMAAALVELFPTSVRYTALSVPYHTGIGILGGLMPMTAFAIAAASGDIFAGLWYPVFFGALGAVSCLLFFPETKGKPLA